MSKGRDEFELEDGLLGDVDETIRSLPHGDPMRMMLIMVRSIVSKQRRQEHNPMMKLGDFIQEHPALASAVFAVVYLLSLVIPSWLLQVLGIDPRVLGP